MDYEIVWMVAGLSLLAVFVLVAIARQASRGDDEER